MDLDSAEAPEFAAQVGPQRCWSTGYPTLEGGSPLRAAYLSVPQEPPANSLGIAGGHDRLLWRASFLTISRFLSVPLSLPCSLSCLGSGG